MWKRATEDNRRLRKLVKKGYAFAGAYEHPHGYLKRFSYSDKDLKKLCNRAVRRKLKGSDELLQRNLYRKVSDYDNMCW